MMTRAEFTVFAIKAAERALQVPPGWWGTWRDVTNGIERVRLSRDAWVLSTTRGQGTRSRARVISRHDSRAFAISKGNAYAKAVR